MEQIQVAAVLTQISQDLTLVHAQKPAASKANSDVQFQTALEQYAPASKDQEPRNAQRNENRLESKRDSSPSDSKPSDVDNKDRTNTTNNEQSDVEEQGTAQTAMQTAILAEIELPVVMQLTDRDEDIDPSLELQPEEITEAVATVVIAAPEQKIHETEAVEETVIEHDSHQRMDTTAEQKKAAVEEPEAIATAVEADNPKPAEQGNLEVKVKAESQPQQKSEQVALTPKASEEIKVVQIQNDAPKEVAIETARAAPKQEVKSTQADQATMQKEHAEMIESVTIVQRPAPKQETGSHNEFTQDSQAEATLTLGSIAAEEVEFTAGTVVDMDNVGQVLSKASANAIAEVQTAEVKIDGEFAVSKQITDAISQIRQNNATSLNFKLAPESLGEIEIKLEINNSGRVESIRINVEKRDTLEMIARDATILKDALKEVQNASGASLSFNLKEGNHGSNEYRPQEGNFATLDDASYSSSTTNGKEIYANNTHIVYSEGRITQVNMQL